MNKNTNTNSHFTNSTNPNINEIQSSLVLLYNSLKTKITKKSPSSSSSSQSDNNNSLPSHYDCFTLINYIKECIDVLLQISLNEKIDDYIINQTAIAAQQEYEPMLIKYESDIRGHIKAEHQLKLYIDNLQYEIEQLEKEKKNCEIIIEKYRKSNYDKEIKELKNEVIVLKKQNAFLSETEKKCRDDIKRLKEINMQLEVNVNNLKNKIQLFENNTSNNNSNSNSSKPTRKNSSSAVSTNSGCCGNNNNNTNYIPKRVIKSVTSQLTKRNKISSHSVSNSSSHNKNINHVNNNSSTSQLDRSLSKQNDNNNNSGNSLIKNINLFNHNLSSSLSSYSNKKQSYSCNNHHRNRSVGNYNSKKNYDQIHLIRELLLKKEPNSIVHKSSVHSKEKAPHYPHNKSISGGYINMNANNSKHQSANNSGNINDKSSGSINNKSKKCMIYNKHSNKKIASSLIINNSNNAYVNNINIITSSPKNG